MKFVCKYSKSIQYKYESITEMNTHIDNMKSQGYIVEFQSTINIPGQHCFYNCIFTKEDK